MWSLCFGITVVFAMMANDLALATNETPRDPSGERAFFQVVQDRDRTSRLIRSGDIVMRVLEQPVSSEPLEYAVRMDYRFNVFMRGEQRGYGHMHFLQEVFEESFLIDLRENRHYEATYFKAEHRGFATVRNIDGRIYRNADRVLLYEIEEPEAQIFADLLRQVAAAKLGLDESEAPFMGVDDMEILAHITYGEPVFGGVRADISGVIDGVNVKVGADYLPGR